MCLDTATDMNKTLNTVPEDNYDADTDLGYEKKSYGKLSISDNESLHITIVPFLSEESATPMIADEDAVEV